MLVVSAVPVRKVIETAKKALYTGHIGDGKIFVYDVENVYRASAVLAVPPIFYLISKPFHGSAINA